MTLKSTTEIIFFTFWTHDISLDAEFFLHQTKTFKIN